MFNFSPVFKKLISAMPWSHKRRFDRQYSCCGIKLCTKSIIIDERANKMEEKLGWWRVLLLGTFLLLATGTATVHGQCPSSIGAPCSCATTRYEPVSVLCDNAGSLETVRPSSFSFLSFKYWFFHRVSGGVFLGHGIGQLVIWEILRTVQYVSHAWSVLQTRLHRP